MNLERTRPVVILLVEDSHLDARVLQESLHEIKTPHQLRVVGDGEQALAFLHRGVEYTDAPRPDLVLLDLHLPNVSGFEVLAAIKQTPHLKDIPVLVLTSSEDDQDVARAYQLQASCYLNKPRDVAGFIELAQTIERLWLRRISSSPVAAPTEMAADLAGPGIGDYDELERVLPRDYHSLLDPKETQQALFEAKRFIEANLCQELNLSMVTVPLIVDAQSGVNDYLDRDGSRTPIQFRISNDHNKNPINAQIVQAATKWKRLALGQFGMPVGEGLLTDMRAVRKDYFLDHDHSVYVDQWDWEQTISEEQRNLDFLTRVVRKIWQVLKAAEARLLDLFPRLKAGGYPELPEAIQFLHAEDLLQRYPDLPRKQRETRILQEHPAVFIYGIGWPLADGNPHEMRAADYDDWSTETSSSDGRTMHGLNGDILVWNPVTQRRHELSSMGIRVNAETLKQQLEMAGQVEMLGFPYHQAIVNSELPLSIGGGIGQSRTFMLLLRKAHLGEVSVSVWPQVLKEMCAKRNIHVLQ